MLIQTRQNWFRRSMNILFTLLAWAGFVYLMLDGGSLLLQGHRPRELDLPIQFFATVHSLLWYLAMAAALTSALIIWAKYNEIRAARYRRRQRIPEMPDEELSASFDINPDILPLIQNEQLLIVHNDDRGQIVRVSLKRQGLEELDVRKGVPLTEPDDSLTTS